jgi:hypothetical protein
LKQNYASWGAYVGSFWSALVFDQSTGNPKEYGGGFPGYGRRVALRFGAPLFRAVFKLQWRHFCRRTSATLPATSTDSSSSIYSRNFGPRFVTACYIGLRLCS